MINSIDGASHLLGVDVARKSPNININLIRAGSAVTWTAYKTES